MNNEDRTKAVGLFNYAHSYAVSAVKLEMLEVDATHCYAPVYFLYFHAIELYLKSLLIAQGITLDELRFDFGHNIRKLAERAKELGLVLTDKEEEAVTLMAETDNIISSRYIRVGLHKRLPFSVFDDFCQSLHTQIGPIAYEGSVVARRPELWI